VKFSFKSQFSFNRSEVDFLFSRAKVALKTPGLTVLYAKNDPEKEMLCGKMLIITSRKSGGAVERNLVRRRLKHLFYTKQWAELPLSFIVITYRQVHQFTYQELEALFTKMIAHVSIF
jgi:ribonuclease P protein component